MKTIGMLGGFGPQATMDFEARVHRVAEGLVSAHRNEGYPPMVSWYCRHPPFLLGADGLPQLPRRLEAGLAEAATRLGALVDFVCIPSNGVHMLAGEIEQAAGRPVLSIIETTLAEVRRRGWKRVGVLGLREPVIYTRPLHRLSIDCQILDASSRRALDHAIFRTMEGRGSDAPYTAAARVAVAKLRGRNIDGIILGCTELPILLGQGGGQRRRRPDQPDATARRASGELCDQRQSCPD
ncbi:MAG TPA: aspartate/glutamate racemase family protein [Tepidisphaeraceae bacterium]|nr:aspartate/glutamate racemase family protein [Tepidisphaeraceae bacterium]